MDGGENAGMLEGHCALATGSVGGIGFAVAKALAEAGARVVLNGLADKAAGDAAAKRIAAETGREAMFDPADLTEVAAIERMFEAANSKFGHRHPAQQCRGALLLPGRNFQQAAARDITGATLPIDGGWQAR